LRDRGQTLRHAEGEAEVDGEGEARARAEECAGDGIKNCRVDESFARAEVVVGHGEVVLEGRLRESAYGLGVERLGFGAEEDAGGGVVFLREFVGVEVVGCVENPGGG
jgi:hypothetical protein